MGKKKKKNSKLRNLFKRRENGHTYFFFSCVTLREAISSTQEADLTDALDTVKSSTCAFDSHDEETFVPLPDFFCSHSCLVLKDSFLHLKA